MKMVQSPKLPLPKRKPPGRKRRMRRIVKNPRRKMKTMISLKPRNL
jgi:hypothetical protein